MIKENKVNPNIDTRVVDTDSVELPLNIPEIEAQHQQILDNQNAYGNTSVDNTSEDVAAEPEVESTASDTSTPEVPDTSMPDSSVPERISNKHFKALREEKERAQRERDELIKMLQEERARQYKPEPNKSEPEDDFGIDADNFVEGKDLKRFAKEVMELKKELQQYKQKTAMDVTEAKLRAEHPDFNKVFSEENINSLKQEHPEIAATILGSNADPYNVAKSAYKMIKKLGIYVEDNYANDREVVQKNLAKPRPLVSASPRQGSTPLSKANDYGAGELTDDMKAALWREIQEYSR